MDPQLSATRAQHRLVTAIAVPLALTLFIVAALTLMVVRLAQLNRDVAAIERSISLAHHVERLMIDAETGLRGYLLVDGVDFLEPTINADRELPARLAELRASVTGRPDQLARVDRLEQTFQQWRRLAETELEAKRGGGQYLEIVASRRPKWLMDDIRRETDAFVQSGHEAQAMRTAEVTRFTRASVAAIVACGVALTAAMWLVSRRRVLGVIDLYAHALDETGRQAAELREAAATLERRVSERTRELQQTNEELEAFSYSVSHDLRAPLRHVNGFAKLLAGTPAAARDARARHYIDRILRRTQDAGELIDALLAFVRTGRVALAIEPIATEDLVREAIELVDGRPGGKVNWDIGPLPDVHGDRSLLRQVFVNLLDNSVKYTRHRAAPRVSVTSATTDTEVVFTVRDNGAGFDGRYAARLFNVFQRLHTTEEFEGTGIGLAIVRRVVERHQGRVWASSTPGDGAEFSFALPRPGTATAAAPDHGVAA